MGTWTALSNQPTFNASTMLLLTDGTVMCQDENTVHWWRLTPNSAGSGSSPPRHLTDRGTL